MVNICYNENYPHRLDSVQYTSFFPCHHQGRLLMSRRQNVRKPLSPIDTAWYRMDEPTNLMMITGIFTFEAPISFETLKSTLRQRMLRYRRFKQIVVRPRLSILPPYWKNDPNFDIDSHIHRIALPEPGNQETLQELVNDFMSMPLDYSKPLWQIHLVENYLDGCALLCRLHHCIGDGIVLMRLLLSLTDDLPEAVWINDQEEFDDQIYQQVRTRNSGSLIGSWSRTRKLVRGVMETGKSTLNDPNGAGSALKLGFESSLALANLLLLEPDPSTIYKGKLGVRKHCAWSQPIALSDVKSIGSVTGGTVNDVLLTAATGALARYMRIRGESTGGLNIRAAVPVNLRPTDEEIKLGNAFGLVFLSLPVGIEDPLDRLTELKSRMDKIKGTPEAIVAYGILNAIGIASNQIEELVVNMFGEKATAVMTNVPGPRETRYFAGQPIKDIMFWVPQSGRLGLGVSIISYDGKVLLGIATDAGLTPDPESIVEAFHREFDDLMELVYLAKEADLEIKTRSNITGESQRCNALTKKGEPCKNKPVLGSTFCHVHSG